MTRFWIAILAAVVTFFVTGMIINAFYSQVQRGGIIAIGAEAIQIGSTFIVFAAILFGGFKTPK